MVLRLHPHWLYAKVLETVAATQLSELKRRLSYAELPRSPGLILQTLIYTGSSFFSVQQNSNNKCLLRQLLQLAIRWLGACKGNKPLFENYSGSMRWQVVNYW